MAKVEIQPLTPARWDDVVALFGPRGACAGCWCMFWRLPARDWNAKRAGGGAGNRRALERVVERGGPPGLIAYVDGVPAGWCALAPRADYVRLANSRVLAPLDERPVWSVPCFFVAKPFRRQGLTVRLLRAAARDAARRGARILEGYPVATRDAKSPDAFVYTGLPGAFEAAGFREVARRSPTRPIYRKVLRGAGAGTRAPGHGGAARRGAGAAKRSATAPRAPSRRRG